VEVFAGVHCVHLSMAGVFPALLERSCLSILTPNLGQQEEVQRSSSTSPLMRAAQMKSFSERPPMAWVQ